MEVLKFGENTNFHDNIQIQNLEVGKEYTVHLNQQYSEHGNLQKIKGTLVGKEGKTSFTIQTEDGYWHRFFPNGSDMDKINTITSGKLSFEGNGENNGTRRGLKNKIMEYIVGPNRGGKKSRRKTKNKKSKKSKTRKMKKNKKSKSRRR